MRLALALIAALAFTGSGSAGAAQSNVVTVSAVEDIALPFWCDWGYDWDERCYRDDSDRLGVGGVDDKVWRSALRFPLDALPATAHVKRAELRLWYDATCVAPRKASLPCDGRGFEIDVHPILTEHWLAEREIDFGPLVAAFDLEPLAPHRWLLWDLSDLVVDWQSSKLPNHGVLLKLADAEEDFGSSGPYLPSSTYAKAALRPKLRISYTVG